MIKDGTYEGVWSAHRLRFKVNGKTITCSTELGVRGLNVPVTFEISGGLVLERTIKVKEKKDERR